MIAAVVVVAALAIALTATMRSDSRRRKPTVNPYVEGLKLLLDGDRSAAFASLQRSVKSGVAPTDAYIRLGELLRENGEATKALQMHRSLTVKSDLSKREKVELFVNIALDYSALGNAGQAVVVLETAVKSMGLKDPEVFRLLAREYQVLGNADEGYRCLREMKRHRAVGERELALYLCTAGEVAAEEGDLKEAKKLLQKALKHDSENSAVLLAMGNLEEQLGNENEALERWKKVAVNSPELSADALRKIEHVMFNRGTFGEVEQVYRSVLEARQWDEYATLALASFYKKQGRGRDAIEFLEEFRSMHPRSIGTTVLLTSLHAAQEDSEALETFLDEHDAVHAVPTVLYECSGCGFQSPGMRWHCPRCNSFDSFVKKHED